MERKPLTYAELRSLQISEPRVIQEILEQHGWKITKHQTLADLHIVHWTWGKKGIWRLVAEYGEGYDNTIVYQTSSAQAYHAAAKPLDFANLDRRQERDSDIAAYKVYFGEEEQVIIVGTPKGPIDPPLYTLILTTTSNVDAIWFESDYLP
jgi:hypothetical protein